MSILIKGMEMPTSCPCELTGVGYDLCCSFVYGIPKRVIEYYECCENGTRPDWCPLIEIPPHGDLIDRDALLKTLDGELNWYCGRASSELHFIHEAPTIIEAEEGE